MALRLIQPQGLPYGLAQVDPTINFQAGMITGFKQMGADIVSTLANGQDIQPFGIIDDVKDTAFTAPVVDEIVIIPAAGVPDGYGHYFSTVDCMGFLQHPLIRQNTFQSDITVYLNRVNGTITVPSGSMLNYDRNGDGIVDSFKVTVSYTYEIAGQPGEDTTTGSGQMTIWFTRGIYATDQFETNVDYKLNDPLYCSLNGKFTTQQNGPVIGMVTAPPTALIMDLEMLWL